jgi:hypothetical protein
LANETAKAAGQTGDKLEREAQQTGESLRGANKLTNIRRSEPMSCNKNPITLKKHTT